ncbi:hypothetical protein QKX71_004309, partial [Salmonella enterica]|nr:hypothetical protein [Salmonella enterica]
MQKKLLTAFFSASIIFTGPASADHLQLLDWLKAQTAINPSNYEIYYRQYVVLVQSRDSYMTLSDIQGEAESIGFTFTNGVLTSYNNPVQAVPSAPAVTQNVPTPVAQQIP